MPQESNFLPQIDLDSETNAGPMTLPSTNEELVKADVTEAFQASPIKLASDMAQSAISSLSGTKYLNAWDFQSRMQQGFPQDNPLLTPEDANAKYWQPGMNKFTAPIHDEAAAIASDRQVQLNKANDVISRAGLTFAGGVANNLASSALSLLDPTQDLMYFVPVFGEEAALARVAKGLEGMPLNRLAMATTRASVEMTRGTIESSLANYALTAPVGQNKSFDEYVNSGLSNVLTAMGFAVGASAFVKAFSKGGALYKSLTGDTQEKLTNSIVSENPPGPNSVMALDKNVNEVEAQLGINSQTLEKRQELMDSDTRPKTSEELRKAGQFAEADKVEKLGQASMNSRALIVKQQFDQGLLAPKTAPKQPEVKPLVEPDADGKTQNAAVDKQLTGVMQSHDDMIKQLKDVDPEKEPELAAKNEEIVKEFEGKLSEQDEEINRVSAQKAAVQSAVQCVTKNGI